MLTKLLLAPVSGPWWVMNRVVEAAERQLYDEDLIRAELAELEILHESGQIDDQQLEEAEEALLERLREARARREAAG
jgi:hypothetical protein